MVSNDNILDLFVENFEKNLTLLKQIGLEFANLVYSIPLNRKVNTNDMRVNPKVHEAFLEYMKVNTNDDMRVLSHVSSSN